MHAWLCLHGYKKSWHLFIIKHVPTILYPTCCHANVNLAGRASPPPLQFSIACSSSLLHTAENKTRFVIQAHFLPLGLLSPFVTFSSISMSDPRKRVRLQERKRYLTTDILHKQCKNDTDTPTVASLYSTGRVKLIHGNSTLHNNNTLHH